MAQENGADVTPKKGSDAQEHLPPPRSYSIVGPSTPAANDDVREKQLQDAADSAEKLAKGAVAKRVYQQYFLSGGNLLFWALLLTCMVLAETAQAGSDYFLAYWSNQATHAHAHSAGPHSKAWYVSGYAIIVGCAGSLFLLVALMLAWSAIRSASLLHNNMLGALVRAPQVFYDLTPLGRIVNRCSKDQDNVDNHLPGVVQDVFGCGMTSLGTVLLICVIAPFAIPGMLILAYAYYWIQKYYLPSSRELKRMESVSRSPIYSHYQETFAGLTHIRATKATARFMQECIRRVDANTRIFYYAFVVNRWLGMRLEVVGCCVVFITTMVALTFRHSLGPGVVGLAITVSMALSGNLVWMVRQMSEMEVQMNSVDRIIEYSTIPSEAAVHIPGAEPPKGWPSKGEIIVDKLTVRYRKTYQPVLRNVCCHIRGGEKIGIVGRTGAGKSTLTLAMFRIMEAEAGSILIDDIDVSKIGLRDLRMHMSIIPQDPVLFEGTVRSNLDPFSTCSDEELWSVLQKVQLDGIVRELPCQLDAPVDANGDNWSMGQRQLICLGRVLVRKTRIVLMDEATASLDYHTDHLIKMCLRMYFVDCTVITIAHRLDTIIDSDRVMVFDAGTVVEFDSPAELLKNPNGFLTGLVRDAKAVRSADSGYLQHS